MSAQHNKIVVRRYIEEVLQNGRLDLIDELFSPELRGLARRFAVADPEPIRIHEIVAEGDTVMVRWDARLLNGGQFNQSGFAMYRLESGRIVNLAMMDCNGVTRRMGAAEEIEFA